MSTTETTESPKASVGKTVQTERLRGEAVSDNHFPELSSLLGDERVMRTLKADGRPFAEERIRAALTKHMNSWEEDGFGFWMWWEKESGDFVGRGGLRRVEVEGKPEVEVAFAFIPEYWNLGFATELAAFCKDVAFGGLGLDSVIALALVHNSPSRWVMEKVGMEYERDCVKDGAQHALYRMRR